MQIVAIDPANGQANQQTEIHDNLRKFANWGQKEKKTLVKVDLYLNSAADVAKPTYTYTALTQFGTRQRQNLISSADYDLRGDVTKGLVTALTERQGDFSWLKNQVSQWYHQFVESQFQQTAWEKTIAISNAVLKRYNQHLIELRAKQEAQGHIVPAIQPTVFAQTIQIRGLLIQRQNADNIDLYATCLNYLKQKALLLNLEKVSRIENSKITFIFSSKLLNAAEIRQVLTPFPDSPYRVDLQEILQNQNQNQNQPPQIRGRGGYMNQRGGFRGNRGNRGRGFRGNNARGAPRGRGRGGFMRGRGRQQ